ncbi:MAG: YdcF family protein, partial [Pseudomonadota bacterium]
VTGRGRFLKWRWVAGAVLVALVLDLNGFRHRASTISPGPAAEIAGIAALTGGSGLRIRAAADLLATGAGERLLISGVNPDISQGELARRAGGQARLFACCVDIGYEASTTEENADEVTAWASAHGYEVIALVTSDYHMARARLLLSRRAPSLGVIEIPVRTRVDPTRTFSDWTSFRGIVSEWMKWRVTQALAVINWGS